MGTIVVCTVLLVFGAGITLYSEDGWMLLLVAIILAAAFFFVAVSYAAPMRPGSMFGFVPRDEGYTGISSNEKKKASTRPGQGSLSSPSVQIVIPAFHQ